MKNGSGELHKKICFGTEGGGVKLRGQMNARDTPGHLLLTKKLKTSKERKATGDLALQQITRDLSPRVAMSTLLRRKNVLSFFLKKNKFQILKVGKT